MKIYPKIRRLRQSYTYDAAGHITGIRDGEGNETRYELDEWGRIITIHKPDKTTEQFTYDYAGNIEKATDGNGNSVTYRYNSFNQLKEIIDQTGERETFTYDKHGRRSRHNRKNGTYARYEYNVDNKLIRKSGYSYQPNNKNNGKALELPQVEDNYIYNKEGQLIQAIGGGVIYRYDYTPSGRVKSKTLNNTKLNNQMLNNQQVLQYVYTKSGKISRLKDQTGKETCYEYDAVGRAVRIIDEGHTLVEYSYMDDNSLQSVRFANGITTHYTYNDERNYASLVTKTINGEDILSYQYQYDRNGNRTKIESLIGRSGQPTATGIVQSGLIYTEGNTSPNLSAPAGETRYTYDAMQRLSSAQYPNATIEEYAYDNVGNRVLKRCGDLETRYSYNNRNQLLYSNVYDTEKPYRETSYIYDLQGNLVNETMTGLLSEQKKIPVEEKSYEYDTLNRTSSVRIKRGEEQSTQKNLYDAQGLRCRVEENGETTNFLTNGWSIVAELDKEYNVRRRLVRGYGIVASDESSLNESNRYRFYHTNEHTDVVMLTNTEGNVINQYEYDAFGNYRSIREQEENRYGYTGEVYDNLTEQYYLRARYYNPSIARFTQEDEYRGDGLNLYAYCGNNPVMYVDPSGYKKGSGCGGTGADSEGGSETGTLYHYTNEKGMNGIIESNQLNPSLKANNPKDARYGNGQYLSDITPDSKTPSQLAKQFINVPNKYKYTNYVEIDVSGLNLISGRDGVFVIPNELPLDLTGRIVSSGKVGVK